MGSFATFGSNGAGSVTGSGTENQVSVWASASSLTVGSIPFTSSATGYAIGSLVAEPGGILTLTSTTQGFIPPRLTTAQKNAINPAVLVDGMMLYDSDLRAIVFYDGSDFAPVYGNAWISGGNVFGAATALGNSDNFGFSIITNGTERWRYSAAGNYSNTTSNGTAYIHLKAGTTAASTSFLKFTTGEVLATPEAGAWEFVTDNLYFTITTGAARKEITLNDIALTSGRVPFATTNGRLTDNSSFTYNGTGLAIGAAFGTISPLMIKPLSNVRDGSWNTAIEIQCDVTNAFPGILFSNQTGTSRFGTIMWTRSSSGNTASSAQAQINVAESGNIGTIGFFTNKNIGTTSNTITMNIYGANVGIGLAAFTTVPTARLQIAAGTATASTAPLKFTSGTSLTTAEAGAVEFTTDDLFFTITTGAARKRLVMAEPVGGLTSGRVPYATTNGRLTDATNLTFNGSVLTVSGSGSTPPLTLNNASSSRCIIFQSGGVSYGGIGAGSGYSIYYFNGAGTAISAMRDDGRLSVGASVAPNAWLHLSAGLATANFAPLKFTSGTNLTTAEAGAFEYNGTDLFFTKSGTTRGNVLVATAVTTEVVVTDTTLTITYNGTTYKVLARA